MVGSGGEEGAADALAFEALGGDRAEQSGGFVSGHCGKGAVIFYDDATDLIRRKIALLDKEAGNVAARYLLFFPCVEIQCGSRCFYRVG